jgi:hypothetical protein
MTTVAYSTHLLLWAHELRPNLAGDWNGNGVADLLDEAKIGARFLLKLRYQPGRFLHQVSDEADHGEGWRLPENDALAAVRPAYYGPGKNHLGRYVAALARAARAYATIAPSFADSCRVAALDAYAAIASAPNLVTNGFYDDGTYDDKWALGAIELYLTTNQMSYLNDAKSHADAAGPDTGPAGDVNGLADALLAPFHAPALANLLTDGRPSGTMRTCIRSVWPAPRFGARISSLLGWRQKRSCTSASPARRRTARWHGRSVISFSGRIRGAFVSSAAVVGSRPRTSITKWR